MELMLRLYLLQNLYNLSDMQTAEQAIYSRAFSGFRGISSPDDVPDGDTIGRFRNLLIKAGVQKDLFAQVVVLLKSKDMILKKGTLVDSTIISSPSSTKNKERSRDPQAHSVKKGNEWKFGYKAHIGADSESGPVHSVKVTAANIHKEHHKSSVRAKVEHVFAVIKNLFGYRKTRYRDKRKQTAKLNMLFALANLYLADKRFGLSA